MSDKLKVGFVLGGLFAAGALGLAALNSDNPNSCSVNADGDIYMNFNGKPSVKGGPAIQLTDDGKQCLNWNGGSTPPDWVVPVVPAGPSMQP